MRASIWIASVLATVVLAAPDYDPVDGSSDAVNAYFELLSQKVQEQDSSVAPLCDLSNAKMPSSTLPQPTGLVLKHVAVGRGTQNYTCMANNATAKPVSIGAVATLYNASCIAASNGDILATLPNFALQFNIDPSSNTPQPTNLELSGHHFFLDNSTPYFTLDTANQKLGQAACSKNGTAPAPTGAPAGQGGQGFGSVAWLQLLTKVGATGKLMEVYRINTAGGQPPPNCGSSPASFQVQYAAEYWFWESA